MNGSYLAWESCYTGSIINLIVVIFNFYTIMYYLYIFIQYCIFYLVLIISIPLIY